MNYLMTWDQAGHRWRKRYKGKTYSVSCKALEVNATKEESREAANEWWTDKLESLNEHGNEEVDE